MAIMKYYDEASGQWKRVIGSAKDKALSANTEVTVGTGGDFATINEALEHLSYYYPVYKKSGITAIVRLLTGFEMSEQVLVDGMDLGWITITSVDSTVNIVRSALTERFGEEPRNDSTEVDMDTLVHVDNFPAFGAWNNATLPIIDVLFDMDATGDWEGRNGISATNQSSCYVKPYKGFINVGDTGIYVTQNSHGYAYRANFDNAGRGRSIGDLISGTKMTAATCFRGSWLNVRQATLTNAANDALYTGSSSVVEALNADFSGAGDRGIRVYANGRVNARDANISNCGGNAVYAINNSIVNVGGANLSNSGSSTSSTIRAAENAIVNAQVATIGTAPGVGVHVSTGGVVNVSGCTINGGTDSHGIICETGARVSASGVTASGHGSNNGFYIAGGGIISRPDSLGSVSNPVNTLSAAGIIFK